MDALKEEKRYTYSDYLTWDDDARYELIDGIAYMMSPAPTRVHQRVSGNLYIQLGNFLKDKHCQVYAAPFDVRLNADTYDDTVVQPDLLVVCDRSKLNDKGCAGAPDMIIEILSPSTARHDKLVKFQIYQKAGVREYWIVDPETKTLQVFILNEGVYSTYVYGDADVAQVHVLEGCEVNLQDVFAE